MYEKSPTPFTLNSVFMHLCPLLVVSGMFNPWLIGQLQLLALCHLAPRLSTVLKMWQWGNNSTVPLQPNFWTHGEPCRLHNRVHCLRCAGQLQQIPEQGGSTGPDPCMQGPAEATWGLIQACGTEQRQHRAQTSLWAEPLIWLVIHSVLVYSTEDH